MRSNMFILSEFVGLNPEKWKNIEISILNLDKSFHTLHYFIKKSYYFINKGWILIFASFDLKWPLWPQMASGTLIDLCKLKWPQWTQIFLMALNGLKSPEKFF